jgi:hypothetical protein
MSGGWKVESLTRQHDRQSFDCGVEELNEFLKKHARQNAEKDVSRRKFEFKPLLDDDLHLFLFMATIRKIGWKVASL